MTSAELVAICVNYRCEEDVAVLVDQLLGLDGADRLRILVVDNNAEPEPHPRLLEAAADPRVHVSSPGANLGYYGAAAWALERELGDLAADGGEPEWVLVSNPDIAFPDPRFLVLLKELHGADPPAVLAPAVLSAGSGRDLNPHFRQRPSQRRIHFLRWLHRHYLATVTYHLASLAKARLPRGRPRGEGPETIYAPHGAFTIFNRSYFEAGGTLRHVAFLYGEELFVAETARSLGLEVVYDPRLVVRHRHHVTTGGLPSRELTRRMAEASSRLAELYFSAG